MQPATPVRLPAAPAPTALLTGLLDDAALFPPGLAPMPAAVTMHAAHQRAWYASMVGPFLCPASRLAEHADALAAARADGTVDAAPVDVGVVLDTGADAVDAAAVEAGRGGRRLVALELALRDAALADAARPGAAALRDAAGLATACYVEVPLHPGWESALDELAAAGVSAKLRTGGTVAAAFPTAERVAAFLVACAERALPVKCTAGLHGAVRNTSPERFEQHGLLNLLCATAAALDGAAVRDVAAVLEDRDAGRVVGQVAAWPEETVAHVRAQLRSVGTCSVLEPVEDLVALGLLPDGGTAR